MSKTIRGCASQSGTAAPDRSPAVCCGLIPTPSEQQEQQAEQHARSATELVRAQSNAQGTQQCNTGWLTVGTQRHGMTALLPKEDDASDQAVKAT
jgi:hypothetical protein